MDNVKQFTKKKEVPFPRIDELEDKIDSLLNDFAKEYKEVSEVEVIGILQNIIFKRQFSTWIELND